MTAIGQGAYSAPLIRYSDDSAALIGKTLGGRYWFGLPPLGAPALYPVLLDLFESDFSVIPQAELRDTLEGLIDIYVPLVAKKRADLEPCIHFDSEAEQDNNFAELKMLAMFAHAFSRLGEGFGLAVPVFEPLDDQSKQFIEHVVRQSADKGFAVCFGEKEEALAFGKIHGSDSYALAPMAVPGCVEPGACTIARAIVALSPFTLTVRTLERIAAAAALTLTLESGSENQYVVVERAASEHPVPSQLRAQIVSAILSLSDTACHRLRCWTLLDSPELLRDFNWLRVQFSISGKSFLYQLYLAVAVAERTAGGAEDRSVLATVQAARLAPHATIRNGFELAIKHYNCALQTNDLDLDERLDAMQQLANVHAVRRTPEDLRKAEELYTRVLAAKLGPSPTRRHLQAVIRSFNGLALVRFREGQADAALSCEEAALDLARRNEADHPDLVDWAERLVNYNVATLKLLQFGDVPGAIETMETIEDRGDVAVDIASLKMRNHEYEDARILLRQRYAGRRDRLDLFEEKDVFGIVSLALIEASNENFSEARDLLRAAAVPISLFGNHEVNSLTGRLKQLIDG